MPARDGEIRAGRRRTDERAVARADRCATPLGHRGRRRLDRQVADAVVRHPALLRLAGVEGLQDAYPGAAVEVPVVHALHRVPWRSAQARLAALAGGLV